MKRRRKKKRGEGKDDWKMFKGSICCSGTEKEKAPAAVVGFQFQHTALQALFQNITSSCKGDEKCTDCAADNWACYLIDDNGYVIAAEDRSDAGQFFGELRGPIMSSLVKEGVFERIRIFDYQAVCFKSMQTSNDGSILLTVRLLLPFVHKSSNIKY